MKSNTFNIRLKKDVFNYAGDGWVAGTVLFATVSRFGKGTQWSVFDNTACVEGVHSDCVEVINND